MLKYLHIENIAVIEKTDFELSNGFNVLTGETGAGKSIIIDAINAVLGERTSKELIRSGCDKAEVSAIFSDLSDESLMSLNENGFEADEEGNLLIRRVLSLSGNGSIKINGKPATAGILRAVGRTLINIHGQHDNQGLLDPDTHYLYIDRLAENQKILDEYYREFKKLNAIRKELAAAETDEDEKRRMTELLQYQISELEAAQIKPGEVSELKEQLETVQNYQKTMSSLNEAYFLINGSDDEDGAASMVKNAQKSVLGIKSAKFDALSQKLGEIIAMLDDVGCDIKDYTQSTEIAGLDGEKIGQRLDLLYKLMLKYGDSEEKMLEFLEKASDELEKINLSEKRISELADELDNSTERLVSLGDRLTASRVKAAEQFSRDVTSALSALDMPGVVFEVNISKGRYTKLGCDNVQFFIKTNAGEGTKPLSRIASGGELSRVMLAIKSVLADKDDVDTLIFDEIDTGISGRAAGKVGARLKLVSGSRQVICVTHLAQIAAFAANHLLISKRVENDRTFTSVDTLSFEDRITEIARIMSGTEITENLYNSAKELLDRSSKNEDL